MRTDTTAHTMRRVQLVAEGLATVLGPQDAAAELRRLYGERRATDALVVLSRSAARRHLGAAHPTPVAPRRHRVQNHRVQDHRDHARAGVTDPHVVVERVERTHASTGVALARRGARPTDWL